METISQTCREHCATLDDDTLCTFRIAFIDQRGIVASFPFSGTLESVQFQARILATYFTHEVDTEIGLWFEGN